MLNQPTPAVASKSDGIQSSGPQTLPAIQAPNIKPPAEANMRKLPESAQKGSNSFEKIMMRLSTLFPNYTRLV